METKVKQRIAILVTLLILFGSIISSVWIWKNRADGTVAYIYQNGKEIKVIPLDMVTKRETFTIHGEHGEKNVIQIEHGRIQMIEASCPDKICIQTGAIQNELTPIVCLPNNVMIKIQGSETSGLDVIAQ